MALRELINTNDEEIFVLANVDVDISKPGTIDKYMTSELNVASMEIFIGICHRCGIITTMPAIVMHRSAIN